MGCQERANILEIGKGREVRVLDSEEEHYFKIPPKSLGSQLAKSTPVIILVKYWVSCEMLCSNSYLKYKCL